MGEQNTGNMSEPSKKRALLFSNLETPSAYTTKIYKNTCSEGLFAWRDFSYF